MSETHPDLNALLDVAADRGWLVSLSRRLLADDASSADDVASRAVIAAWERPPRKAGALRAWLSRAVRNFASKERRERIRRARREDAAASRVVDDATPHRIAALEEARRKVVAAVLTLPEPQRTAILLRHWSGLTPAQIAARGNENESTVRNRLHRAHEALRGALDSEFEGRENWRRAIAPFALPAPFVPVSIATSVSFGGPLMAVKSKIAWMATSLVLGVATYLLVVVGSDDAAREEWTVEQRAVAPAPSREAEASKGTDTTTHPDTIEAELQRSRVEASEDADHDVHVVRVVRESDRAPVAFATVKVRVLEVDLRRSFERRHGEGFFEVWDPERDLEQAETRTANERGEIELLADGTRYLVGSRIGSDFGWISIDAKDSPRATDLVLEHDPIIEVLVVDSRGVAVSGEAVALKFSTPGAPRSYVLERAVSDERGLAVMRHVANQIPVNQDPRYFVTFGFPYESPPERTVDLQSPTEEPIRLIVPDRGRVELEFTNSDGVPHRTLLGIGIGTAPISESVFPMDSDLSWRPAREGRLAFYAGVGTEIGLYVCAPDERIDPIRIDITGPSHVGDVVRRTVVVGNRRPVLRGRVVDVSGVPMPNCSVVGEYTFGDRPWFGGETHVFEALSDAGGAFELPLSSRVRERRPESISLRFEDLARSTKRRARVDLGPSALSGEDLELGSIVAEDPPRLVAGTVIDEIGQGVGGSRVGIEFVAVGGAASGVQWFTADADGSFDIREWPVGEANHLRLRAVLEDRVVEATKDVEIGSIDVVLRLLRGGSLEGSFRLEPGVDPNSIQTTLAGDVLSDWATKFVAESVFEKIEADGSFSFTGLKPGRAILEVRDAADGRSEPLLRVPNLVIEPGATNRDPRIQNLSLSSVARRIAVDVLDSKGHPIEGALLRLRPDGRTSGLSNTRLTNASGHAEVWIPKASHSLLVSKPGFRTVNLPVVSGTQQVMLLPAIELRISVSGLPTDSSPVMLYLMPQTDSFPDVETQERWLETGEFVIAPVGLDGNATVFVVAPGTYALRVSRAVAPGRSASLHQSKVELDGSQTVRAIVIDLSAADESGD